MINDAQYGDVAYHPEELAKFYSGEWTEDQLKAAHAKRVADDAVVQPQHLAPQQVQPEQTPVVVAGKNASKDRLAAARAAKEAAKKGTKTNPPVAPQPKTPTKEEAEALTKVLHRKSQIDDMRNSQTLGPVEPIEVTSADEKKAAKVMPPVADPVTDPTATVAHQKAAVAEEKKKAKAVAMEKARAARKNKAKKAPMVSPKPAKQPAPQDPREPSSATTPAEDAANSQTRGPVPEKRA